MVLKAVFAFVQKVVPSSELSTNKLSSFQEFVATLVMFWLNSQVQDLAYCWYIFGYWNGWLQWILHYGNWLHGWIVKVNVNQCQNVSVASFGTKVAVIIDCFKVFMECPSNLLARASTCFSYKHTTTLKRFCYALHRSELWRSFGNHGKDVSATNILRNGVKYWTFAFWGCSVGRPGNWLL